MKNMKHLLLGAAFFALIFTACTKDEHTDPVEGTGAAANYTACDFIGFKVGSVGTYTDSVDYTMTCIGNKTFNGKEWLEIKSSDDTTNTFLRCETDFLWLKSPAELYLSEEFVGVDWIDLRMVKSNAKVGDTWTDNVSTTDSTFGITYNTTFKTTVKSVDGTRSVNGKTYSGVTQTELMMSLSYTYMGQTETTDTQTINYWYAPNYFLIEGKAQDGSGTKLKSFQP